MNEDSTTTFGASTLAMLCSVKQPDTGRYVIIQDLVNGSVVTLGARFIKGRWIGDVYKTVLQLSKDAIWAESFYFTDSCAAPLEEDQK